MSLYIDLLILISSSYLNIFFDIQILKINVQFTIKDHKNVIIHFEDIDTGIYHYLFY